MKRRHRALRGWGAWLLLGAAACTSTRPARPLDAPKEAETASAAPVPVEPGVSRALAEYRRQQLSGLGYALQLMVPTEKRADIVASEIIRFRLKSVAQPLQLDFKEQTERLQRLTVNGQPVPIDHRDEHLIIPAAALRVGPNEISIEFLAGNLSLNRNDDYLYTLLVPDRARTVFPVFDQPDLKASFQLRLHVPGGWQVLTNAPLTSIQPTVDGMVPDAEIYSSAPSDTISTYLFSFVAGRFQAVDQSAASRNMRLLHRETDPDKLRLSLGPIFQIHRDALSFMERYTGIPYPFKKLDFAALPDFQYGGMEHVGAIDYKASTLFLDAGATQDQLLARSSLISHETAHMWFGDLVTMRWFDDVWMKEVFANFMADKITQVAVPGANYDLKFVVDHYPAAYGVDRTAGANPIRQNLDNLRDAGSLYGNIIYHKAPIMMRQLERLMGEEAFRLGLQEYLKKYAFGNASWPELIQILDARTPADLQAWNQMWVNQPGRPIFDYELKTDAGTITSLALTQRAEDGSTRLWPQLVELQLVYADGRRKELTVNINQSRVAVPAAAGEPVPAFVQFNSSGLGYGVFPLDDQLNLPRRYSYKELGQVLGQRLALLPEPVARAAAYVTLYENVLNRRYLTPRTLLDVYRQRLLHEREELNLRLLTGQLGDLYWKFLLPAQRAALAPTLEQELWRALEQNPAPNQKKLLFKAYQSVALSRAAQQRLYQVWERQQPPAGVKLTEDDYTALALALAVRDYPAPDPILPRQLSRIQNPDRQQRLRFLMPALAPEQATRDAFFAGLADEHNREKEAWVVSALGYLHHPLRVAASEKYLPQSLALLEQIQQTGDIFFPYSWLQATLGYYQTPTAANTVRDFLAAHPQYNPKLRAKLQQAADDLFRAEQLTAQ
ncbi:M1 family aminopeptidase [Hymenobacter sp. 15J16-1T3B]|uniref:M1 family metallopeptidase n=1 Tax=Hymenobacter sp. 15J16-1T3B TaxID=2886941 RepID=UPI001D110151|nr:M1 family aminopeptidase [Hymenobacter sp. 15J16-1T3B]MCC3158960.1 M1 family aminopeptidase [Hymenobacter sp. 15J16-1T3B]